MSSRDLPIDRERIGWWAFVLCLGVAAAFVAYSFVGIVVLGVFGYYATRPIYERIDDAIGSDSVAAAITVLLIVVPVIVLVAYTGFQAFQQLQQVVGGATSLPLGSLPPEQRRAVTSILQSPRQVLSNPGQTVQTAVQTGLTALTALSGALVLMGLAVTLSYFLLEREEQLSAGLVELLGGRDTTAYAYAVAVDDDLESIFFGNLLFVLAMSVIATLTYWATNLVAPDPLSVPLIFVLGVLTGLASLIPIVVGKIVYLPVVAYLAAQAVNAGGTHLAFVGGALVAYFLVLDVLPQTFLQPYITGRQFDTLVLLFAYLLGPILFGWYGFFLLPIVFVLIFEAVRIPLPELVHGEALTPDASLGESAGSDSVPADAADAAETETQADDAPFETE